MIRRNKARTVLALAAVAMASLLLTAGSANAELLVYEPFDYLDGPINGQGGALGTAGTWSTNDTGEPQGWWCHPEGVLTGQFDDIGGGLNQFDGTVANLPTAGGFAGPAGPEDQTTPGIYGTRDPTGSLDASIDLDPSVTATFQSGTTTWFSYVGAHADNRNQGSPTFMIGTDPTTIGARGLTMQNEGNGIGGVGGPPRDNLTDVYPHYFQDGTHHQTPGGYQGGWPPGDHNGIVLEFASGNYSDGVLTDADVMSWTVSDANGFGAPNIVVGKIEWDADTGGYDIITVVKFLETQEINEEAFDALVAAKPHLSSANWPDAVTPADPNNPSNKPDLDQSEFDTLNFSSVKFFVDELRIATTFEEVVGRGSVALDGDADGDGDVDAADYIMVKTHFGGAPAAGTEGSGGDFNETGTVDWEDLQALMTAYNAGTETDTIPEPATLFIMLAAGLPALLKRRRHVRS